jgi:DNA-binding NtrC family response regulator
MDPWLHPTGKMNERAVVLVVSPWDADHAALRHILHRANWKTLHRRTCREAVAALPHAAVILCAEDLPDGDWMKLLEQMELLPDPPLLILASRFADSSLYEAVLQAGGYDLVGKPFLGIEVLRAVGSAYHWHEDREKNRSVASFI